MSIAQQIIESHKLKFGSQPTLQHCSVSGNTFVNADCFDVFPFIENKSIDAIICDLPFGTTNCKWDSVLDLNKLWEQYKRILKENGVVILFAQTPFDKVLGCLTTLKFQAIFINGSNKFVLNWNVLISLAYNGSGYCRRWGLLAQLLTTGTQLNSSALLNGGTSAPLLAIYCWQQLNFQPNV